MNHPSIPRRELKETPMWQQRPIPGRKNRLARVSLISAFLLGLMPMMMAQQPGQKTYASPEEASQALYAAAQSGDKAALLEVFGPEGSQIISSGDEVQDQNTRDQFVGRYQEMHRVAYEPDGTATLYVGAENWPLPIPLVHKGGAWYFDAVTGKK